MTRPGASSFAAPSEIRESRPPPPTITLPPTNMYRTHSNAVFIHIGLPIFTKLNILEMRGHSEKDPAGVAKYPH
jgi:hypothetical protein